MASNKVGNILYKTLRSHIRRPQGQTEYTIPKELAVVHGHFSIDHFKETIPEGRLVTVLREPLARTISHYRFFKREKIIGGFTLPWFTLNMPFEEFAFHPEMQNVQACYLRMAPDLSQFEHVGITERMDCFCHHFDPEHTIQVPYLNTTGSELFLLSEQFIEAFKTHHSLDYALYEQAVQQVMNKEKKK
jgi:hypothetical protein